ncbi:MAG TPA: MbcA/ParS/Xre antitoxin family protein [Bryobacteraceae bacterium]|jgi:hypothetical protein|nr:MbcA/ParS/Xre antitoxin family protein [Bryobacteraceae bacterium]
MGKALPIRAPEPLDTGRRHDPEVRKQMSAPAMRAFFNVAGAWQLSVKEQTALLGHPPASTYHKYKSGQVGRLPYDMLVRISLVLGIYKALHILYPDDALADRWVKLPNSNPLFGGEPALARMAAGIDGLLEVRRLLDGRRG